MADAVVRHVVTFGRVLREVGLEVGPGRVADALRGLDSVDLERQDDVYFALRQTLVSRHDELELFDRAFNAWFLRAPVLAPLRTAPSPTAQQVAGDSLVDKARDDSEQDDEPGDPLELGASGQELLREKDFAEMTPDEYRRVKRLIAAIAEQRPLRSVTSPPRRPAWRPAGHAPAHSSVAAHRRRPRGPADPRAQADRTRSSSSSATSRARWTRTRARSCCSCTPPSARGPESRPSRSARASRG